MAKIDLSALSLSTAEVSIQAIKLNGKAMTIAAYEQIPSRCPYAADDMLPPEVDIIGWVNYHNGKCWPDHHIHLLYTYKGQLYRYSQTGHRLVIDDLESQYCQLYIAV
jgi:hypothetical protein